MSLANQNLNVGIVGVGVMGEALLSALINSGQPSSRISIYEKREDRALEITSRFKVKIGRAHV